MKTKTNKQTGHMKLFKYFAIANLLLSPIGIHANAQVGGSNGGGEDGVFKSIRYEVDLWMQKNIAVNQLEKKLELKSISGSNLYASFAQAVRDVGERVVFTKAEINFGKNSRICKNEDKTITCNVDAWNATRGDTRYMIVLHEYLGVAGIETNVESDYSRYPISSKILGYVKTKEAFELGMSKVAKKTINVSVVLKKYNSVLLKKLIYNYLAKLDYRAMSQALENQMINITEITGTDFASLKNIRLKTLKDSYYNLLIQYFEQTEYQMLKKLLDETEIETVQFLFPNAPSLHNNFFNHPRSIFDNYSLYDLVKYKN